MTRIPLPNRRPSATVDVAFGTVTVGFDALGQPREVFANGPKEGSDMQATIADACVVISIALQHGVPPAALGKSLGSVPDWNGAIRPASAIGIIVAAIAEAAG